jgi:putative addiction module killer protein
VDVLRTEEFADRLSASAIAKDAPRFRPESTTSKTGIRARPGIKTRNVGSGVVEMKIDFGLGYRFYYIQRRNMAALLLCGGDKSSQNEDILRAKILAAQCKEGK